MRSLTSKLALAFALTSLAGIVLAAIFVRQFVVTEFDAYVLEQRRADFVEEVSTYYATYGSWKGVETLAQSDPPPITPPDGNPPPPIFFLLADTQGVIVLAPKTSLIGQPARAEELANGTPITVNSQVVGTVLAPDPSMLRNPAEERYLSRSGIALASAGLIAVIVSLGLGLLIARIITRPLRDMTAAARAIAAGNLRQEVPVRSRDELGLLAKQFNAMSADLDHSNELRRRMTADIAHDLRTPLTVIAGYLEALRDETLRPTAARFTAMHDETQVLLRLVQDLHTLSLADAGELPLKLQAIAPQQLIERIATSYRDIALQSDVAINTAVEPNLPEVQVDVEQLMRALGNLVSNALRYTPEGGQVILGARRAESGVALIVRDTGQGISAEHLANIFERFYRADESRHQATGGSGLGLAIVRSIVEAHGDRVTVESVLGEGTTFTIILSANPPKKQRQSAMAEVSIAEPVKSLSH